MKHRIAQDLVAVLEDSHRQMLLRALIRKDQAQFDAVVADRNLPPELTLSNEQWVETLLDALEEAMDTGEDDDPDNMKTQMMPNLARFAKKK